MILETQSDRDFLFRYEDAVTKAMKHLRDLEEQLEIARSMMSHLLKTGAQKYRDEERFREYDDKLCSLGGFVEGLRSPPK